MDFHFHCYMYVYNLHVHVGHTTDVNFRKWSLVDLWRGTACACLPKSHVAQSCYSVIGDKPFLWSNAKFDPP